MHGVVPPEGFLFGEIGRVGDEGPGDLDEVELVDEAGDTPSGGAELAGVEAALSMGHGPHGRRASTTTVVDADRQPETADLHPVSGVDPTSGGVGRCRSWSALMVPTLPESKTSQAT